MAITKSKIPLKNLPTYNDIYKLGLTDAEIVNLENMWTVFSGSHLVYIYKQVSANRDITLHFNNFEPCIFLEETDQRAKSWGYDIYKIPNNRYYLKFTPKAVDKKYLEQLSKVSNKDQQGYLFNSMDDLRSHVFSFDLNLLTNGRSYSIELIEMLYWSAGALAKFKPTNYNNAKKYDNLPTYIYYIVDVLQLPDDTRIAIYAERSGSYGYYNNPNVSFKSYITRPDNPAYNWTDPDRYFSHMNKDTGHGRIYYLDPKSFPSEKALSKYARGHNLITVENNTLELINKRDMKRQAEETALAQAQGTLRKKLENKIADLAKGTEFSFNEVTFRDTEIQYEDQILSSQAVPTRKVLARFLNDLSDESFNFDNIYEEFCNQCIEEASQAKTGKIQAKIGAVDVEVHVKTKANAAGVNMVTNYINGKRINKDELTQVLKRALCYLSTADFDDFLDSVSKCSLRYHKHIAAGIALKVYDDLLGEHIEFKIGLSRTKHRNYISFGDTIKYAVKDTNKLLNIVGSNDMTKVINTLIDTGIVGMNGKDIRYIIDTGKAVLEKERTKEKEVLNQAIAMFKCQRIDDGVMDNGRIVTGYTVKGKLREYIVDESTLRVFEYPTGKYLCMVDKGQNEHANTARLVSRMFALANDSKLANEITTLAT